MFRRQSVFAIVLVGMAAWGVARPASANTIKCDTTTPISNQVTDWTDTNAQKLSFRQFDTRLGTLDKIQLDLAGSISTVITVTNTSVSQSRATGDVSTQVQLTVGDNVGITTPQLKVVSDPFVFDLDPNETEISPKIVKTLKSSNDYSDAEILSYFLGTGTVDLTATTSTKTSIIFNGGNASASQATTASLGGSITYFYTAVPEPSTLVLLGTLGAGLLAGALFRRTRR